MKLDQHSRRQNERIGRWAEWAAAALLSLKGYRVLARRFKTRSGEIDLVAVRGQQIAFLEVKARRTREAAEVALLGPGAQRMATVAAQWIARNPRYRHHQVSLDAILFRGSILPVHVPQAMQRW